MKKLLALCVVALLWAGSAGARELGPSWLGYYKSLSGVTCDGTSCTFAVPILGPAFDNCATPPYSFTGDETTGLCSSADGVVHLRSNGVNVFSVSGTAVTSTVPFEVRNGGTAERIDVYNTYTDASNYRRLELLGLVEGTDSVGVMARGAGTGANPALNLGTFGTGSVNFLLYGGYVWHIAGTVLRPSSTDVYDLGLTTYRIANVFISRSIQGSKCKALAAGVATTFVTVTVPQTALVNYADGSVIWNVRASDATDIQTIRGRSGFNCVNKADTETCAAIVTTEASAVAASAGAAADDLACTITAVTGLADMIGLAANCASTEMTETSLQICYRLDMTQPNTVTPN